jgi:hypothetical protein
MANLEYWECSDCGFDAVTIQLDYTPICPLCAGDNGRDVPMVSKPIADAPEKVEGKDARNGQ